MKTPFRIFSCLMVSLVLGGCILSVTGPDTSDFESPYRNAELLGELRVEYRADRHTLLVGRSGERYRRLAFVAQGNDIEIKYVVLIFFNERNQVIQLRHRFAEGSRTRMVDIPGGPRPIHSIEVHFRNTRHFFDGPSSIQVYGVF